MLAKNLGFTQNGLGVLSLNGAYANNFHSSSTNACRRVRLHRASFLCSFFDSVDLSPASPLSFPNTLPRLSRKYPCAATSPIQMRQYFLCLYESFDLALMVFYFLVERNYNLFDFQVAPPEIPNLSLIIPVWNCRNPRSHEHSSANTVIDCAKSNDNATEQNLREVM